MVPDQAEYLGFIRQKETGMYHKNGMRNGLRWAGRAQEPVHLVGRPVSTLCFSLADTDPRTRSGMDDRVARDGA